MALQTENCHYKPQLETRVECDASSSGLGAALEKLPVVGWNAIALYCIFPNTGEER